MNILVTGGAGTKWNFLPSRPGLVGGHCISVDPYYLTHKAQEVGHHPQVILAVRRTNDGMCGYVADQVIKLMLRKGINPVAARILVLGLAFKENSPTLRNTRVVDIVHALEGYNARVDVFDPWVDATEAQHEYGLSLIGKPEEGAYDAIVLAVGHDQFRALGADGVRALGKPEASIVYGVKYVLPREWWTAACRSGVSRDPMHRLTSNINTAAPVEAHLGATLSRDCQFSTGCNTTWM